MKTKTPALAGLLAIGGSFCYILNAQAPASVWAGVYTPEQAKRGAALYKEQCAACHADNLAGDAQTPRAEQLARAIPPLNGDGFKGNWDGRPLSDLFDKIKKTMPRDDQGKMTLKQTADVLAYMLNYDGFPSGKAELPADPSALTDTMFQAVKPKE
jgi:cytochrome c